MGKFSGRTSYKEMRKLSTDVRLEDEMYLAEIRKKMCVSQGSLAYVLGVTIPSVSRLENQRNITMLEVQKYIEAIGGELDIVARFPDAQCRIKI